MSEEVGEQASCGRARERARRYKPEAMRDEREEKLTRRKAIAAGLVGAATLAGITAVGGEMSKGQSKEGGVKGRMPVAFLPHGGGPWPFVELGFGDRAEMGALAGYLASVRTLPKSKPAALLVVSAHWEEAVPTVMTGERPPLLFDYSGFPPESYQLTWPAPGSPTVAARVRELLGEAGFESATDERRGFDHGVFVPLKLTYPDAEVPTVQLSLKKGLDPKEHLAMGKALAPLRDEGVFIVGSGMTFHNMRGFMDPRAVPVAERFDAWLREATTRAQPERDRELIRWASAPDARNSHPREEHLLPLMVIAGAAGEDVATVAFNGTFAGKRLSAYHFG